MIPGRATPEGTSAFAIRSARALPGHWKQALDLSLSSLGMGTYLGPPDAQTDAKYTEAARRALELGINVIDSAINYRFQRSERAIGEALRRAIEAKVVSREQVLLCTKGGFLAGDDGPPNAKWFQETFVKTGVVAFDDIVADCHCMTPKYLNHEIERSRQNLGVETIDVYYVHNPETQIPEVGEEQYYRRLTAAFKALEAAAAEGKLQYYGTATWDAYRVPEDNPSHVSLERTVECARAAGGEKHRFRVVQLPFSLGMPEAYAARSQTVKGKPASALEAAAALGLTVFTSVPLLQGRLLNRIPADLQGRLPGLETDAQRCLQFARSTPGICAPLCGMKDAGHVDQNFKVATVPPLSLAEFSSLFEK